MSSDELRILADNDQDRAEARVWWRESSNSDKMHVWREIQRHYEDPAVEIMSRFAQLAFAEMVSELGFDGGKGCES